MFEVRLLFKEVARYSNTVNRTARSFSPYGLFFSFRATRPEAAAKKPRLSGAGKPLLRCVWAPVQPYSAFLSGVQGGEEMAEVGFPTALAKNTVQGEHANKASTKVGGRP